MPFVGNIHMYILDKCCTWLQKVGLYIESNFKGLKAFIPCIAYSVLRDALSSTKICLNLLLLKNGNLLPRLKYI